MAEELEVVPEGVEADTPQPVLLRQCSVLIAQEEGPALTDEDFPIGCFEIPAEDPS